MYEKFSQFHDLKSPCHKLEVKFGDKEIEFGTILTPLEFESEPTVKYAKAEENKEYELVMVDLDAMKNGAADDKDWIFWHIKGISGNDVQEGNLDADESDEEDYGIVGGEENPTNLLQHFLFLIYEMKEEEENVNVEDRMLGCCPVAGNFFSKENSETETLETRKKEIEALIEEIEMTDDQIEKLDNAITEIQTLINNLENVVGGRRSGVCEVINDTLVKVKEIFGILSNINIGSNKELRKSLQSLKKYFRSFKNTYEEKSKQSGCDGETPRPTPRTTTTPRTSTTRSTTNPSSTSSSTTSTTTSTSSQTTTAGAGESCGACSKFTCKLPSSM